MAKVCLQAVGLSAEHRRENQPRYPPARALCCPAAWPTAVEHLSYIPPVNFWQHGHPAALSRVMTSKPLHKGLGWLGCCPLPAQGTMIPGRKGSISQPQAWFHSALCPVDNANDPRPSGSAQMHHTKGQLEAQRAKPAAKDTNGSVWLLWKQLLWGARSGCRHCRAWQGWQITQHASSAWYEEQKLLHIFPYFLDRMFLLFCYRS